jgi:hypothetical protein
MKPNLDSMKAEIQEFLAGEGIAVFHGYSRSSDSLPAVYWDCEHYPDFRMFVNTAKAAGVQMMVFHQREFTAEHVEDAIERLETCDMPRDEYRGIEKRLEEMRAYEGFTCAVELSFDHQGRIYMFDLRSEWYEEFSELLEDLDILGGNPLADDEEDPGPIGGYFSKN